MNRDEPMHRLAEASQRRPGDADFTQNLRSMSVMGILRQLTKPRGPL
jgi:hypothetical protein